MRLRSIVPALVVTTITTLSVQADVVVPNTFQAAAAAKAADVNANFSAVATGINENAASIRSLSTTVTATAASLQSLRARVDELSPAIQVGVGDTVVGRLLGFVPGAYFTLQIPDPPFVKNEVSAVSSVMWSPAAEVLTANGYVVSVLTISVDSQAWAPLPREGDAVPLPILFDQPNCTGNAYVAAPPPSQTPSYFSRFLSLSPWIYRNGFVFGSPDPLDVTRTYYVPPDSITTATV